MPLLRTITRRLQEGDFNQSTFVVRLICGLVDLWADRMDPIQRFKLFILLHKIHYIYSRFPQTVTNSKSTPHISKLKLRYDYIENTRMLTSLLQ